MRFKNTFLFLLMVGFALSVSAQKYHSTGMAAISKEWKGNTFTSTKTFEENIAGAAQLSILSKIFKHQPLAAAIAAEDMVTIFALTDAAFMELPEKSRDSILKNTRLVESMIKYLAVPGRVDSNSWEVETRKKGGQVSLKTLEGEPLLIRENNGKYELVDSENRTAIITASDFYHKNGLFHIVTGLVFPATKK